MSPKEAARVLELLAQGIDPDTGEVVAQDSVLNSPTVIRALFIAANSLRDAPVPKGPEKPRDPSLPQAGKPWSQEEAEKLLVAFDSGVSIEQLAHQHGRTKGGIASRLVKLGRIDERSEVYQREIQPGTKSGEA